MPSAKLKDRKESVRLLLEASRQNRLSGLTDMLRVVAEYAGAFGAVMWEVAPGADLHAKPPKGRLFVLGSWFNEPDVKVWYYLTLSRSLTGKAILDGTPKFCPIIEDEPLTPPRAKAVLGPAGITASFNIPLELHQFKAKASINVYWQKEVSLSESQQEDLAFICSLIPDLYAGLVDRVGLNLIHSVDKILRQKSYSAKSAHDSDRAIALALGEVVEAISKVFNCRETSIFLDDPSGGPELFRLQATDWAWNKPMPKMEYQRGTELTGYALKSVRPVRILDLGRYEDDHDFIQSEYPDLDWQDRSDLKAAAREVLGYGPDEDLPPLSFMAVPIVSDGQVRGVIRCNATRSTPYFFDDRQVGVLQLAAGNLGAWWANWVDSWKTELENDAWEEVIRSVRDLNGLAYQELTKQEPSEARIFQEAMAVASKLIEDCPACDIRLKDPKRNVLVIAETFGALWEKGNRAEIHQRKSRQFSLEEGAKPSAAAHVVKTGQRYEITDPKTDLYYDPTFPEVRRAILAPLVCGNHVYGTLGIRRVTEIPFAEHAKVAADLLANQLGLYHFLADEIKALNRTEKDLQKNMESQRRMYEDHQRQVRSMYEDFQHQVRSPIVQASRAIQDVVDSQPKHSELTRKLLAIQGLCAQAERVARSLEFFVSLAQEKPIAVRPRALTSKQLCVALANAARDHQAVMPNYRNIRFHVDELTFGVLDRFSARADPRLFEQAMNNLLDNAGKYSFPNTTIRIFGGLMANGSEFFISVSNKGLAIRGDETKKVLEREYRAESAKSITAEGHGIGLWIADQIMGAHGGRVMVIPTTAQNVTEVRLVFSNLRG